MFVPFRSTEFIIVSLKDLITLSKHYKVVLVILLVRLQKTSFHGGYIGDTDHIYNSYNNKYQKSKKHSLDDDYYYDYYDG